MKKKTFSWAILLSALMIASCTKEDPIPPPNEAELPVIKTGTLNLGANMTSTFFGRVTDKNGNAISAATVTIGSQSTQSDNDGLFFIESASVHEKLAQVNISKQGYFSTCKSLIPGTKNDVRVELIEHDNHIIASGGSATLEKDGATVSLLGEYIDAGGIEYTGNVSISMAVLDPNDPTQFMKIPGSNYCENASGNAGVVQSYGILAFEMKGSSGQDLQLQNDAPAQIEIPVANNLLNSAPSTAPLWFLDEETGYWIEDGTATLQNGKYVGEVSHFTFWTVGVWANWAHLSCDIDDNFGNDFQASAITLTANAQSITSNGWNGMFASYVPANATINIDIEDICGNSVLNQTVGTYNTGTFNTESLVVTPGADYTLITGNAIDCAAQPVSNGWIHVITAGYSNWYSFAGANFNVWHPDCTTPTEANLLVTDLNSGLQQSYPNEPILANAITLGTFAICNTPAEYIDYTIDGNNYLLPTPYYCTVADSFGTGTSIIVSWYGSPDIFHLRGNTDQLGVHAVSTDLYTIIGYQLSASLDFYIDYVNNTTVTFNVTSFPANVGDFFDVTFSGTATDIQSNIHTISGDLHVQRDL